MKIAIVGGLGFIGTNLYLKLKNNHEIKIIDNFKIKNNLDYFSKNSVIKCDITEYQKIKKIIPNFDIIINLAGQTGVLDSDLNPWYTISNNIVGFLNIIRSVKESKKQIKIINASTAGAIYGSSKKICNENSITNPMSYYGLSKKFNEEQSIIATNAYNAEIINLRFSNVYGEYSLHKKSLIHSSIQNFLKKKNMYVYGNGEQTRDFIYVGDLVNIIIQSFKFESGIYNIASGKSYSVNHFLNILKKNHFLPDVKNLKKNSNEVNHVKISNKKILKLMEKKKFKFTSFAIGVKKTIFWYQKQFSQGKIKQP